MAGIDIFTLIVIAVMIASLVIVFVVLGMLPGKIAKQRQHPQAEAINVGSWVTLVCGFVLWPIILIWAYVRSEDPIQDNGDKRKQDDSKLEKNA